MTPRLSSRSWRFSSRSALKPARMKPPSRFRFGSSSASAVGELPRDSPPSSAVSRAVISAISAGAPSAGQAARQADAPRPSRRPARHAAPPRSRGPPRSSARRDRARANVGNGPQAFAQTRPQHLPVLKERDRIEPRVDRGGIGQRAGKPGRQFAASGAGHRAVDGGEQAALLLAGRASASIPDWRGSPHRSQRTAPPPRPARRPQHRASARAG